MANFKKELVGLLGQPVAENPTEVMADAAFASMGLDWRFLTLEVAPEDLGHAVQGLRACNFRGFLCTIPHKIHVMEFLDRLSPAAEAIGAVNCVGIRDGILTGDNTDGKGFLQSVEAVRPAQGLRAVILGAGGAARAIGVELAMAGADHFTIVNRSAHRGEDLARHIEKTTGVPCEFDLLVGDYEAPEGTKLLVNATSIGLYPDIDARVPVNLDRLHPEVIVCDVIPNPPRTRLIREAEARGHFVLDGLGMLVNQGVIGLRLWTGREPDPQVMRQALEDVFSS
ncbi:MAG TPA: shikimate dehydrogenase [Isosphaeraceae bacterium]|nr:shikimate dehydrogenase [Isosphaeraceae bacterium]